MKSIFAVASIALASVMLSEVPSVHAAYDLVRSWEGQTFFDGWDFYGYYDNLTNVSPLWSDQQMTLSPNVGRRNLGKPIRCHQRPPGVHRQQREGHS